jgi:hypothetical protein
MIQVGDTVSWFIKEGGQQTALVIEISEKTAIVLNWLGERVRVSLSELHETRDTRMINLRILDIEDPREAQLVRETYLAEYIERVTKNGALTNPDKSGEKKVRRQKISDKADNDLVKAIISVVLELGEASKSDILAKVGTEVNAQTWTSAIESALLTRKIGRKGKKRGTKYYDPKKEG